MDLSHLAGIAIKAALAGGKIIQQHMDADIRVEEKDGGTSYAAQVVTEVDRASETAILAHLRPTCAEFDLALLTEETPDDGSRLKKDFFWCVDPMDGTLAFINKYPGFSVAIALVRRDGLPCIGVVYDPVTDTLYHAVKGEGVYKNYSRWNPGLRNDYLTYVTDKRLADTPRSAEINSLLNGYVDEMGWNGVEEISGAGSILNGIRVLENRPACLLKFPKKEQGGGSLWDFAATACLFNELGLPATNFEGGKLDLNREDGTFMNHEGIKYTAF